MSKPSNEVYARYQKAHVRQIKLALNITTDADILARLDSVDNKQGYIKQLIRADIAKPGK